MSNYNKQNNGQQKTYLRANVGKVYIKAGENGPYGFGDFCGVKLAAKFDPEGNISLQVETAFAPDLKEVISVFLDQSGLGAKYAEEKAAYLAKKESSGQAPRTYAPKPAYQQKKYTR